MHGNFWKKNQKLWKKGYHILTMIMVFGSLLLFAVKIQMSAIQEQDVVQVMERKSSGQPKIEVVGKIKELDAADEIKKVKVQPTVKKEIKKEVKTPQIKLSQKEYSILTRIVEAETTGGDLKSKRIVAGVILNRVKDKQFPDTIEEVVFQRSGNCTQFSPISDGRYNSVTVTEETKKAVKQVLKGQDDSKGALFFANRKYSSPKNMKWFDSSLKFVFSYGGHEYFTVR